MGNPVPKFCTGIIFSNIRFCYTGSIGCSALSFIFQWNHGTLFQIQVVCDILMIMLFQVNVVLLFFLFFFLFQAVLALNRYIAVCTNIRWVQLIHIALYIHMLGISVATGCSLNIVFFSENFKIFRSLVFLSSPSVYTQGR